MGAAFQQQQPYRAAAYRAQNDPLMDSTLSADDEVGAPSPCARAHEDASVNEGLLGFSE
jgi:hypothetical protein